MKNTVKLLCFICIVVMCLCTVSCSGDGAVTGGDLYTFTFSFDDGEYTLPEKLSAFTDNGFAFPDSFKDAGSTVAKGALKSTYLENGDNWFNIEIVNTSDSDLPLSDCAVGRVTYDFSGNIKVYTAGGFLLNGKTLDEVTAAYGKPMSEADYGLYTEIIYDKDPNQSIYDRYTFRFDKTTETINYIDITYYNL